MQLEIKHLTKRYGDKTALDDFSYCFDAGIYGILGANGAGKTTLMNLITDNVRRDAGEILFNGTDVLKLGKRFRSVLGYMPQQQGMYPDFSARISAVYGGIEGNPEKTGARTGRGAAGNGQFAGRGT